MPIVNTLKIDNTDYVIQDKRYDGLTGFTYKGTVESYSDLPTSDVSIGDTYYVKTDSSGNYGYNVTAYYNEGNIAWGQSSNKFQIDDNQTSTDKTWSSSKIDEELSDKLNAENPVSTGTASFCGTNNVSGWRTFAVGEYNTVTGSKSSAFGDNNTVNGNSAFAIGMANTVYSGFAAGKYNDVGYNCFAFGNNTTSSGDSSIAEGNGTTASGMYSHAEGYNTVAAGMWQHVQGRYNVEDNQSKYADIIGAGWSSDGTNIETVDWDGNMEIAGDLRIYACGGNNPISVSSSVKESNRRIHLLEEAALGKLYTEESVTGTSYQQTVPSGSLSNAIVSKWGGKSVVWNQLVEHGNFDAITGWSSVRGSLSVQDNIASLAISELAVLTVVSRIARPITFIANHKYYCGYDVKTTKDCYVACEASAGQAGFSGTQTEFAVTANKWNRYSSIKTAEAHTGTGVSSFGIGINNTKGAGFVVGDIAQFKNCVLVDITRLYGAGNEPTTTDDPRIAAIEAYAAEHPEYNAGEIVNADVVSIDTVGKNLYSGVWENTASYGYVYKLHAKAGQTVCVYANPTGSTPNRYTYIDGYRDNAKVDLQSISNAENGFWYTAEWSGFYNPKIFTMTEDSDLIIYCAINDNRYGSDAASHFNELQIEIASARTAYAPYHAESHPIPSSVLTQYPLRSAGNVYDTITFDGTKWWHTQNTDLLNIGTLEFTQHTTDLSRFTATKPTGMKSVGNDVKMNQTSIYQAIKGNDSIGDTDKATRIINSSNLQIRDTRYVTVESFKTAMAGVYMVFELRTPIVTDITNLMGNWRGIIEVEQGGTVTFAQSNGKIFPIPNTINYLVKTTGGA